MATLPDDLLPPLGSLYSIANVFRLLIVLAILLVCKLDRRPAATVLVCLSILTRLSFIFLETDEVPMPDIFVSVGVALGLFVCAPYPLHKVIVVLLAASAGAWLKAEPAITRAATDPRVIGRAADLEASVAAGALSVGAHCRLPRPSIVTQRR